MDLFFSCDIEGERAAAWGQLAPDARAAGAVRADDARGGRGLPRRCARGRRAHSGKDAHDTGRNIALEELPVQVQVNRGWAGDPYGMMSGIQHGSWDGAVFLGYHSGAGTSGSPMAHTMEPQKVDYIEINGERASEFTLNAYMAGLHGVPVCFVSGDAALCDAARRMVPGIAAVPVVKGEGGGATSLHPALAAERIEKALYDQLDSERYKTCFVPMPLQFEVFVRYRSHQLAYHASFYPGASLCEEQTVRFACENYADAMRFFHFVL
ncbi:MAG: M55 family metallopeptidase [Ruthenibacterium sp.]